MSDEIFKWMPQLLDYSAVQKYSVIISEYENGMEQRQLRSQRPIGTWKFNYTSTLLSPTSLKKIGDEILSFFNDRNGPYDNFYLPSWELEFISTGVVQGATTIDFGVGSPTPASLGFSATRGAQGNYVYLCSNYYMMPEQTITQEVLRINDITGQVITFDSAIIGAYGGTGRLQKAFKVRFLNEELERPYKFPYLWESPIEFIEDIAAL